MAVLARESGSAAPDIDSEYGISAEQVARFRQDGYIKLKGVFSRETLDAYGREITRLVLEQSRSTTPLEERNTYGKAFLQVINLWRQSDIVREFVSGRRLARIVTELLQTEGVRLFHDQALYKESGGGYTPWHMDQFYWPLATDRVATAWIPLHAVPIAQGPLMFSVGSQRIRTGRDLEISDESERVMNERFKISNLPVDETPFDLGEVSIHLGRTFHRAGPNTTQRPREVMTIIYMDRDMRLAAPRNKHQGDNWNTKVGDIIASPLNPILYERRAPASV
ncbi:phytanoyl-CoA dioxygenase family protein [Vineibacter terrae]|uniref:phytanoyl-CoA dioxygenase family protein n=1 Tax=Vineibacter terrae TaxID=2586908 RepID=UPI002E320B00|nr:phytanoyl-CoA dioxygenase family protein [Vineibacter terrae]HEX2886088.1 phytanoyl-CoA dioxygenase family protein [Vineibacter terrae]